jgi:hypothetical protein
MLVEKRGQPCEVLFGAAPWARKYMLKKEQVVLDAGDI